MTVPPFPALYTRRRILAMAGLSGLSLPAFLRLQSLAAGQNAPVGKAKSCIIIYCWGGMSPLESWNLKPEAPKEPSGSFKPIQTATPGIQIGEHLPLLARQTD